MGVSHCTGLMSVDLHRAHLPQHRLPTVLNPSLAERQFRQWSKRLSTPISVWQRKVLTVGGLNLEKQSLRDLVVLQVDSEAWLHPSTTSLGPPPRVFHCAAAQGGFLYVFGGHTFHKDIKGLHKYNDLWRLNTVRLRPTALCRQHSGKIACLKP